LNISRGESMTSLGNLFECSITHINYFLSCQWISNFIIKSTFLLRNLQVSILSIKQDSWNTSICKISSPFLLKQFE